MLTGRPTGDRPTWVHLRAHPTRGNPDPSLAVPFLGPLRTRAPPVDSMFPPRQGHPAAPSLTELEASQAGWRPEGTLAMFGCSRAV